MLSASLSFFHKWVWKVFEFFLIGFFPLKSIIPSTIIFSIFVFLQAFAVLFFFMLFTLGIGSVVALQNVVVTVLCDQFPSLKYGRVALITSILGFLSGLMYLTPVCIIVLLFFFKFDFLRNVSIYISFLLPIISRVVNGWQHWSIILAERYQFLCWPFSKLSRFSISMAWRTCALTLNLWQVDEWRSTGVFVGFCWLQ